MITRIKVALFLAVFITITAVGVNLFISALEVIGAYAQRVG